MRLLPMIKNKVVKLKKIKNKNYTKKVLTSFTVASSLVLVTETPKTEHWLGFCFFGISAIEK